MPHGSLVRPERDAGTVALAISRAVRVAVITESLIVADLAQSIEWFATIPDGFPLRCVGRNVHALVKYCYSYHVALPGALVSPMALQR